jgi:YVTN family beta-propeller protein
MGETSMGKMSLAKPSRSRFLQIVGWLVVATVVTSVAFAQQPASLLVLAKSDNTVAIVDPATSRVLARIPAGPDPHEIIASDDGKFAYISNYGGSDSTLNTISVVDLVARKPLPPIDLGAVRSTHGLAFAGGKLYFTAETNKVIGRYDPATQRVDWVLGTGQDRTHMIAVSKSLDRIVTSNVNSATISIIEQMSPPSGGLNPPGGPRQTWEVTNVPAGRGAEGFDISPDGKEIWAANARDATVTIIDVATKKATETFPIPVKGANRLKFTPDGKRVLVSGLGARDSDASLVVIDAAARKEVKQLNLGGGAAGILIAPDGSRAYVAVSSADKIAVVDLKTLEVTGEINAGKQPDGLAWAMHP